MKNLPPLRWLVPLLLLLGFGAYRVRILLLSEEDQIKRRFTFVLEGFEEREPKRIWRAFQSYYRDEQTGYGKDDIQRAAMAVMEPGVRYRGTLAEDGFEILDGPERRDGKKFATVRANALIETRYGPGDDYRPYWDLEFTADLEHFDGRWWIVATRDVNHDQRDR